MELAQHIVKLEPAAVELVDRTMIELARDNPAFRPVIEQSLIGEPEAILLVEFAGDERDDQLRDLRRLVELMGDLGLPGSVVEITDAGPQKALWEVRKAGLNIMMSMKGDGKPVSFIEDCAVPLEHLAEYTDRLTRGLPQARHARHVVRARLGRHAARAADPRHAPRRRAEDARDRRGSRGAGARVQGRVFGRARRRARALANGSRWHSARGSRGRSRRSRPCSIRDGLHEPRQDRAAVEAWTTARCSASSRATARCQ